MELGASARVASRSSSSGATNAEGGRGGGPVRMRAGGDVGARGGVVGARGGVVGARGGVVGARGGADGARGGTAGEAATGGGGRERVSRIAAARSTSPLERESSRVKRSVRPGRSSSTFSLNATTRPSPRTSGAPDARASSNRSTTPCGRCCAPRSTMLVRVSVSSSCARNSSSLPYGRVMRIATGVFASSATRRG